MTEYLLTEVEFKHLAESGKMQDWNSRKDVEDFVNMMKISCLFCERISLKIIGSDFIIQWKLQPEVKGGLK